MKWKKVLRIVLFAALGGVLLYFSFRGIKWADFVEGLKTANYFWIGVSMCLGALSFLVRAARWRIMLLGFGKKVTRLDTFDGVNMAFLANFALPRAGEIARCGVVAKQTGLSFDTVVGTVIMERAFDVVCLLILTLGTAFLRIDIFGRFMVTQIWNPFIASLGGSTLLAIGLCLGVPAVLVLAVYLLRKPLSRMKVVQKIMGFCKGVWEGFTSTLKMPHKVRFFLLTILLWALFVGTSYTTILATPLRAQFDVVDAIFLMVVGSFGWVVPVQGGIGAFHFIVTLALVNVYSLTQTQGMVFATISHESQAVIMLLCGIFSSIHLAVKK